MITLQETTAFAALRLVGVKTDKERAIAGIERPAAIGLASHGANRSVLMLGPDTCLVLDRAGDLARDAVDCAQIVVEESGAWRLFVLDGQGALDLIGQLSPADLYGPPDACIATHAGGHPVVIMPRGGNRFELLVARSYAESLLALLEPALART
jgi:heterotetrameric sarcosine oxidase gamma subunit